jgi:hypothetical protein
MDNHFIFSNQDLNIISFISKSLTKWSIKMRKSLEMKSDFIKENAQSIVISFFLHSVISKVLNSDNWVYMY